MTSEFQSGYAHLYDVMYAEKDYAAECAFLQAAFRRFGDTEVTNVLDLGCGTGGHAQTLAERGIAVLGIDRSSSMISRARAKTPSEARSRAEYEIADIRHFAAERLFDAVIMMFAVLGYQRSNDDVMLTLQTARRHLPVGGLLIFDVWYGPAVLNLRPSHRIKTFEHGESLVLRVSKGELDTRMHLCQVDLEVWEITADRLVNRLHEIHHMRYFFPLELELMLSQSGFRLRSLTSFPEASADITDRDWNVACVAEALP